MTLALLRRHADSDFRRALQRNGLVCQTDRDIDRTRITPLDAILTADHPPMITLQLRPERFNRGLKTFFASRFSR